MSDAAGNASDARCDGGVGAGANANSDVRPDSEFVPWSISKAEWDGQLKRLRRASVILVVGACFAALWFLFIASAAGAGPLWSAVIAGGGITAAVVLVVWSLRNIRRWRRSIPRVWDEHGCACLKCMVSILDTPCPRHGYSRQQQPLLVQYWEAVATRQVSEMMRLGHELSAAGPGAGRQSWWRRYRSIVIAMHDPKRPLWRRLLASYVQMSVFIVIWVAVMSLMVGARNVSVSMGVMFLIMPAVIAVMGPFHIRVRERCSACRQELASPRPARCPECAADLTKPGAITSVLSKGVLKRVALATLIMCAAMVVPMLLTTTTFLRLVPPAISLSVARVTGPSYNYFDALQTHKLSNAEWLESADLLIDAAQPGRERMVLDFGLLAKGVASGVLPKSYEAKAAYATAKAELQLSCAKGTLTATVSPQMGSNLFGYSAAPRLVFGGFSVDGGAFTPPAAWSLSFHDLDRISRTVVTSPKPQDQLVFTHAWPPTAMPRGPHTVHARCWIVVTLGEWQDYVPEFDGHGEIVAPAGALVFPLDMEAAVDVDG